MNTAEPQEGLAGRLRTTFGPMLAGLAGGALMGLLAVPAMQSLCRNLAATYDRYPSVARPWLATEPLLPAWLTPLALLLGTAGPVLMGAAAVWLARPRDAWADLSTGLTTALAGTLTALMTCIGWPVVLALVVVPAISDLTLLSDSAAGPDVTGSAQQLVQRYPDLEGTEPARRGSTFMAKLVSDQITGGAQAIWVGVLLAALTAGALALSGALAAGHLRRRGDAPRRCIVPYLEMTLPLSVTLGLIAATALTPAWRTLLGENLFPVEALLLAGLALVAALLVIGVVQRWSWLPRLALALAWVNLLMAGRSGGSAGKAGAVAVSLAAGLLLLHWIRRPGRVAVSA
jgi:hypothetical protein